MKLSLSKYTAIGISLVALTSMFSSCSKFLNVDKYFDDEFKIDSVYVNVRYMEAYMWGAAAMFPDEAATIRYNYTPGIMATDEAFNGLTGPGVGNVYLESTSPRALPPPTIMGPPAITWTSGPSITRLSANAITS